MIASSTNKISEKIFLGIYLDSEKRMLLSQSSTWKQVKIMGSCSEKELQEVYFQSKNYLGTYFSEAVTLKELEERKVFILKCLETYCPTCETEQLQFTVFAQLFIA